MKLQSSRARFLATLAVTCAASATYGVVVAEVTMRFGFAGLLSATVAPLVIATLWCELSDRRRATKTEAA